METLNDTANKILDSAEHFTQLHGFNAFSYKDLQAEVGVKTSSIHYYFPSKQDLAEKMLERHTSAFLSKIEDISNRSDNGLQQLEGLGSLYVNVARENKFCLCGMLASDLMALLENARLHLRRFFNSIEQWVTQAIQLGQLENLIKASPSADRLATAFLSSLEGGMLIARAYQEPDYLRRVVNTALAQMTR